MEGRSTRDPGDAHAWVFSCSEQPIQIVAEALRQKGADRR